MIHWRWLVIHPQNFKIVTIKGIRIFLCTDYLLGLYIYDLFLIVYVMLFVLCHMFLHLQEDCVLSDPQGESDADADIEDTDCRCSYSYSDMLIHI